MDYSTSNDYENYDDAGAHFHTTVTASAFVLNDQNQFVEETKNLAEEVPVAFSYDGTTYAVMMALPQDLHDFAYGFSLTEGLILQPDEIENIDIVGLQNGIDVQISLKRAQREAFKIRRRSMAGPVGCGLCGIESIDAAMRDVPHVTANLTVERHIIVKAVNLISAKQVLNAITRATHAAGFYDIATGSMTVREDVGRHNALDKLCGYLFSNEIDATKGIIVVTSRLSVEMIQKTAFLGAPILVALSAPTAKAVNIGHETGITLIARARAHTFEIYSSRERII